MSPTVRNTERCRDSVSPGLGGWGLVLSLCILTLASGLLYPFAVHADQAAGAAVRSGCEIDYPPFCIVHEDGRADGFSVELMRAALRKMGREVTFRTGPWSEVRGWLERGDVEALPLVGRTPEREELFDFTVPYMTMHGAIVVRKETGDVHTLADLRGRRVGVMRGDNAEEFLRREERDFKIVTAPTFAASFRDLAEGRCDAVVIQRLVAIRLLEETGLTNLKIVERPIREFAQDFCFAVKDGDREMLSILNEGLALAVADGTHRRLHARWFAQLELPADRPIVVGGDHNYPPFEFLDEKGRPAGFTVEMTRAIAREMNMDVRIELGPWRDRVNALRDGRIDALEGMFYSAERDRVLDFSPRYLVIHCVSVVRKGAGPPPTTIEELRGRDLVVQAEDAILDALAERGIDARITTVETQEDVVRAVAEGRNACGLATRFGALHAIQKNGWKNIDVGDQAFYSGEYSFAVPQGNDALLAQFTEGLRTLKDKGEYQRIYEKWLGVYEEHFHWSDVLRLAGLIAAPLLLVAILALLWSRSLKQQVRARTRELREQETFLRAVLDNLPVGVAVNSIEPGVTFNYMNDLFAKIYRTTREALSVPDAFWQAVYGDDRFGQELRQRVQEDCASGDPERMVWTDVPIAREGGETTYITARNTPIHGTELMISSVWDVTERKRAEEDLAFQYRLLRVAGQTARFGGWSVDLAANRCTWSDVVAEIHEMPPGYAPSVEEGIALYAPEWRERITQVFTACAEEGAPYDEEMQILTSTGKRVWVRATGEAVRDEQGDIVQVHGSFQDITDLKQAAEALKESERFLRSTLNGLSDHIAVVDEHGVIVLTNKAYRDFAERNDAEPGAVSEGANYLAVCDAARGEHSEGAAAFGQGIRAVLSGELPSFELEYPCHSPDEKRWFFARVTPFTGEGPRRVVVAHEIITERKQAESRSEHLNQVLRAIRDVNQLITHEADRDTLLRRSCEILVSTRGYHSAWLALRDAGGGLDAVAESGIGEDFTAVRERLERGEWPECHRRALEHPDGIAPMRDTSVNCKTCVLSHKYRDTAALAGALRHAGRDYGVLVVALPEGLADDAEEQSLFRELAGDVAYALHAMETARQRRREEARFRAYVENAPSGIFIADRSGRYVDVNPAAGEITGYSKDELLTMNIVDLLPPEGREAGQASFQRLLEEGRIGEEMPFVHKSGQVRYWIVSAVKLSEDRFLGFAEDITVRKHAEEALAHANEVLSQLLEVARRLGAAMDTETVIQIIRRTARALSEADGVTVVLREDDLCYYVEEDAIEPLWKGKRFPMDNCISGWVMQHGLSVAIEDIYADPRVPHEAYRETFVRSLAMAPIGAETPVGAIGAYWREQHAPTDTEQSLLVALGNMTASIWDALLAREALKRSEETYRLLADNTVDCIWRLTLEGVFEYINPASEALLGYTPREMIGTPLRAYCDDENYRIMEREIGVAINAPEDFKGTIFSAEMLRRDGSTIAVEITGKLLRAEDGSPAALQGVTRDITARMKIEAERDKIQGQFLQAQKMESVGRLAGGVAHDFNNMLSVILGHAELALDSLAADNPLRDDLEEIRKAAERSANLTRQLLAFARRQTVAPKVLDLNETIASMLKMLERLIGEDIDLHWIPGTRLALVHIDPGQVDQMLANLTVNARDAIGQANGKVTIETANVGFDEEYCAAHVGFKPGDYVMLAVSDDGCGMDEEARAQIFEPFFTTKEIGQGTGLGLSTVYGIVKQNEGFINVYSEPDEGTTFKIYLPRHAGEAAEKGQVSQASVYEGHGETVLLVEDEDSVLRLGQRILESMGYDVHAFGAPGKALEFAQEIGGAIHLLITDVVMPEMSGRDLSDAIRHVCPDIRVLFMSGYTANVIAHRGVLDEGVNFIQKPFSVHDLAKKVREVLDS